MGVQEKCDEKRGRQAKKATVSRSLIAAIETKRKTGSVSTWKKLGAALGVGWELLA
ncbi:MAG: hypothetical protein WB566_17015 [Terriglobales bacterium]